MGADRLVGELAGARIVEFPLRGEWQAVQTPASRIPSHGTDMLAQRYALDLIRFDRRRGSRYHPAGGLRTLVLGVPTKECHGWGEPVHAMLDGEVVAAVDGIAERSRIHPVRELGVVLWNALTFSPDKLPQVVGNHVIVRHGDAWSSYVHLTTGSVAVRAGDLVRAGDVLGRVGHTGNSTAPHLHTQLMDGPDALVARGLPCAFRAYEVERPDGSWARVERSVPTADERIRSVDDAPGPR
jgi:murein DD-endopeptidase MepM/ murein hydrolase activator NlpD